MALKLLVPVLALFALSACNTTQGLGEDVSAAGQAIQSEAATAQ